MTINFERVEEGETPKKERAATMLNAPVQTTMKNLLEELPDISELEAPSIWEDGIKQKALDKRERKNARRLYQKDQGGFK